MELQGDCEYERWMEVACDPVQQLVLTFYSITKSQFNINYLVDYTLIKYEELVEITADSGAANRSHRRSQEASRKSRWTWLVWCWCHWSDLAIESALEVVLELQQ